MKQDRGSLLIRRKLPPRILTLANLISHDVQLRSKARQGPYELWLRSPSVSLDSRHAAQYESRGPRIRNLDRSYADTNVKGNWSFVLRDFLL